MHEVDSGQTDIKCSNNDKRKTYSGYFQFLGSLNISRVYLGWRTLPCKDEFNDQLENQQREDDAFLNRNRGINFSQDL
jgi:hypothetical protein